MGHFFFIIPVGSAIWVGIDASNLGFSRGRLGGGFLDMGVVSYVLAVLLIWIVGFPCYLVARGRYQAMNGAPGYLPPTYGAAYAPPVYGAPSPQQYGVTPNPQSATATAQPQFSPDGQWWWDGQQWTPATGTAAPPRL